MKIGKFFRLAPPRKQAVASVASPTATSQAVVASPVTASDAPVQLKKFKRKALLIGVQKVRDPDEGAGIVSPLSAKFPVAAAAAGLQRIKTKREKKKRNKLNALRGPHRDVRAMRDLLIKEYNYAPEDVVILIDDDNPDVQKQPTRENILDEIKKLVKDAEENDRFFFHFAGHSDQEDTDDIKEEDRKNEFILTSDGDKIEDDELRDQLAKPLPKGSSLIAVFDSCHSGSLLDLNHFRCNRVYVPWLNKGHRKTKTLWSGNKRMQANISMRGGPVARLNRENSNWAKTSIDDVMHSPKDSIGNGLKTLSGDSKPALPLSIITNNIVPPRATKWLDSPNKSECMSPVALYCTGNCRQDRLFLEDPLDADVISLSSAQDAQMSWEDPNGMSVTQCLVRILGENKHPTFKELMTTLNHEIHAYYVGLHFRAREYRKLVDKKNKEKIKLGKKPRAGDVVEMNNFQEPQLSSDRPLDMSRHFYP